MATLSSAGIGSGLDVRSIVAQLMAVERAPLAALQTSTQRITNQLSAYGKLQSALGALRDNAAALSKPSTWSATTVATSNATAVAASSDGSAPPGSYSVNVSRLAAAQTLATNTTYAASTDSVGTGSITIELGTWGAGQTTFTAKSAVSAIQVSIVAGADSLSSVRDSINGANAGVTASIVNDANGSRLAIRSTTTGASNAFRITVNDDDGANGDAAGLSQLAFDPSSSVSRMSQSLAAANATATINGVAVSSATNVLTSVLDGLTLRLNQVTTGNVDLTVSRDTAAIKKTVADFAASYSDLIKLLREQTKFNETTRAGAPLQGDSAAVGLGSQLRSLIGSTGATGSVFSRLADIGLEPQSDGTLKVKDSKLDGALGKLDQLQTFFARDDIGSANDGFAQLFKAFGDTRLGSDGVLTSRHDALQKSIDRNADRSTRLQDSLALTEKRLTAQYSRLDTNMAQLNSLQNYVTQTIANWNKSSR